MELESGNVFRATDNITRGEVCEALAKFIKVESEVVTNAQGEAVTNAEGETETTTKITVNTGKTSSGGGGGSSSSSSGGGSSSSSSSSSVTTTVTESTTEATTTTVTETTTEATTAESASLSDAELRALKNVISDTKNLLVPNSTGDAKAIAQLILSTLEQYYADPSYDYMPNVEEAKSMYNSLPSDERSTFKQLAISTYGVSDINVLMPIFGALLGL
jgi:hypothetical protein